MRSDAGETSRNGSPIDAVGRTCRTASEFDGVDGLEQALLDRPEMFVGTLTEKLLTFALGAGIEHDDGPAVRKIVREAEDDDYRFSSLIIGNRQQPTVSDEECPNDRHQESAAAANGSCAALEPRWRCRCWMR